MPLSTEELPIALDKLVDLALDLKASDIHLKSNLPPSFRMDGKIKPVPGWPAISADDLRKSLIGLLNRKQQEKFERDMEIDTAILFENKARVRVNLYMDVDAIGAAMRIVPLEVPSIGQLALPPVVEKLTYARSGLILVTGVTGAGKSTTLAAMIDAINQREAAHIYTIEDPIEFVHRPKKSVITQREIGFSTKSFSGALKSALRADPNVILIGEMRDSDTILNALKAAETGLLVLSTLHTQSAPKTIQRILGSFNPAEQEAVRTQLAYTLRAVVAQQLIPVKDGGRMAVHEIMINTLSIQEAILGQDIDTINEYIKNGNFDGMQTMDGAIYSAYRNGLIEAETARTFAIDPNEMDRILKGAMQS